MSLSEEKMVDELQRYVRITGTLNEKFVEFDFSIDDPNMFVELVLPFDQFQDFCKKNNVKHLSREQKVAVDYDQLKWRFGKPGIKDD